MVGPRGCVQPGRINFMERCGGELSWGVVCQSEWVDSSQRSCQGPQGASVSRFVFLILECAVVWPHVCCAKSIHQISILLNQLFQNCLKCVQQVVVFVVCCALHSSSDFD